MVNASYPPSSSRATPASSTRAQASRLRRCNGGRIARGSTPAASADVDDVTDEFPSDARRLPPKQFLTEP